MMNSINSSKEIMKRRKISLMNMSKANLFINNNPYLRPLNYTNPLTVLHEGKVDLNNLIKKNTKCQLNYDKMLEETNNFQASYSIIQKNKKSIKDKKNMEPNPFMGLINQYKRKGYKIPDLSINSNLFNPSILLTEPNQIQFFYQYYNHQTKRQDKGALYLDKVDQYIKKLKAEENKKTKGPMRNIERRGSLFRLNMNKIDDKELQKENKELLEYNKTLEAFITTSLVNIDTIGKKVPKSTKNKQLNQTKFKFTYKNSSSIEPYAYHYNSPEPSNEPTSQLNTFINETKKKSQFCANNFKSPSAFKYSGDEATMTTSKKTLERTELSIDSQDISHIETIPFRRANTKMITLGNNPKSSKMSKTIMDIQEQIYIDDATKKLIKNGDPSSYLNLIQNKIQIKSNKYDYEPLKRLRMTNYNNRDTAKKFETIYNTMNKINKLDKALIQATNHNIE